MGRIVLFVVQLIVVGIGGLALIKYLDPKVLKLLACGVLFAVIAWVTGIVGARILQGVTPPPQQALITAVFGGLIGAGLLLVPQVQVLLPQSAELAWPVIGAVLGYHVKR